MTSSLSAFGRGLVLAAALVASQGLPSQALAADKEPAAATEEKRDPRGDLVFQAEKPSGMAKDAIRDVVVTALLKREWKLVSKSEDTVVVNLVHRGFDTTLTVELGGKELQVWSESWKLDKAGNRKERAQNERWLANVRKDISVGLGIAAPAKK